MTRLLTPFNLFGAMVLESNLLVCELPRSVFVTKSDTYKSLQTKTENAVPQGLSVVRGLVAEKFSVRVLARLAEAEQKTEVATEQQDYRIAWLTVLRADEGNHEPWRQAFWEIVGNTPEKAIPFWLCSYDAAADEFFPLHMLPLKYTKDWASDYLRGKRIAEKARISSLPHKQPVRALQLVPHEEAA